jgi:hypothetical protein
VVGLVIWGYAEKRTHKRAEIRFDDSVATIVPVMGKSHFLAEALRSADRTMVGEVSRPDAKYAQ